MTNDPSNGGRSRAVFALSRLSRRLQGEVLADGTILSRFEIPATRPIRLTEKVVVSQEKLFAAFSEAARGTPASVSVDEHGAMVDRSVWIEPDGSAVLELPSQRWRFSHAGLLAVQLERRSEYLTTILAKHTLTQQATAALRAIVRQNPFTHEVFLQATKLLDSSPESFARQLEERLETRGVGESDLLPEEHRHWENITARWERSGTLREFIDDELALEHRARVCADVVRGFQSMALTFSAPELVPREWLRELDSDTVLRGIEGLIAADDHFALVGAFEICAEYATSEDRFIALGEQLLDRLFADTEQLKIRCAMFAATFVLATARLAMNTITHQHPVYWRRLTAAAHAGLVVRTCGVSSIDRNELLKWAIRMRGREYLLSVYGDMAVEPRWRPEWFDPNYLAADAFGRIYGAYTRLSPNDAPQSWRERITAAERWVDESGFRPAAHFPAVLQGARRMERPELRKELATHLTSASRRLIEEPSVQNLVGIMPFVEIVGVPPSIGSGVQKVLLQIRSGTDTLDDHVTQAAVTLAAHVAVLSGDVALGDAVADTCLKKSRTITHLSSVADIVCRLVECAAADTDRAKARETLAGRLENLAFTLPMGSLAGELVEELESLQRVDFRLAPLLGRAVHTARLASPRGRGG
jgi:hypothetical protein